MPLKVTLDLCFSTKCLTKDNRIINEAKKEQRRTVGEQGNKDGLKEGNSTKERRKEERCITAAVGEENMEAAEGGTTVI